jgi:hypothetical protein
MVNSKLEGLSAELKTQLRNLQDDMESACQEFLGRTSELVADYFQNEADRVMEEEYTITNLKNEQELAAFANELKELTARVPTIVRTHLNKDEYWAHRPNVLSSKEWESGHYDVGRGGLPYDLNHGIQTILGHVAHLLIEHEYNVMELGEYQLSPGMQTALSDFSERYEEFLNIHNEIERLREEKGRARAKARWDKAKKGLDT